MQDHVHAMRRFGDRLGVARIDLDDLCAGRGAVGGTAAHKTCDLPSGVAKGFGCRPPDAAGGAQHENPSGHCSLRSWLLSAAL